MCRRSNAQGGFAIFIGMYAERHRCHKSPTTQGHILLCHKTHLQDPTWYIIHIFFCCMLIFKMAPTPLDVYGEYHHLCVCVCRHFLTDVTWWNSVCTQAGLCSWALSSSHVTKPCLTRQIKGSRRKVSEGSSEDRLWLFTHLWHLFKSSSLPKNLVQVTAGLEVRTAFAYLFQLKKKDEEIVIRI